MKIYHYNLETKMFTYSSNAKSNPLEDGKYLMPANSTTKEPPLSNENEIIIFNGDNWIVKEDYRGTILYNEENKNGIIFNQLGSIPSEYTQEPPPSEFHYYDNGSWILNLLTFKASKKREWEREIQNFLFKKDNENRYTIEHINVFLDAKIEIKSIPEEERTQVQIDFLNRIDSLKEWKKSVLLYWKQKDKEINTITSEKDYNNIIFDLDQFNKTDPQLSLEEWLELN